MLCSFSWCQYSSLMMQVHSILNLMRMHFGLNVPSHVQMLHIIKAAVLLIFCFQWNQPAPWAVRSSDSLLILSKGFPTWYFNFNRERKMTMEVCSDGIWHLQFRRVCSEREAVIPICESCLSVTTTGWSVEFSSNSKTSNKSGDPVLNVAFIRSVRTSP